MRIAGVSAAVCDYSVMAAAAASAVDMGGGVQEEARDTTEAPSAWMFAATDRHTGR